MKDIQMIVIFSFALFGATSVVQANQYYFISPQEDIYVLTSPFPPEVETLFIYNKSEEYSTRVNASGRFYVYGQPNEVYIISRTPSAYNRKPMQIRSEDILDDRNTYKHTITGELDHWFLKIVNERKDYVTSIQTNHRASKAKVRIQLQNLDDKVVHAIVGINGTNYTRKLDPQEVKDYTFSPVIPNGVVKINVAATGVLGVRNIRVSRKEKDVSGTDDFHAYVHPFKIGHVLRQAEQVFYLENGELRNTNALDNEHLNAFILKSKAAIKELPCLHLEMPTESCCDYLVIYHENFQSNIPALTEVIARSHPNVCAVNVQHIYNALNLAKPSAASIKQFIVSSGCKTCLLVGDACVDDYHSNNQIPSYSFKTSGNTRILSDHYYSYIKNPGRPEIVIARLPFSENSMLASYLQKVRLYKNSDASKYAIFDDLSILEPKKFPGIKQNFTSRGFVSNINSTKPSWLYYLGHGNEVSWREKDKITLKQFQKLAKNHVFNVVDFSCWTGSFAMRKKDSFSESILKMKDRGAITVISAYGYTNIGNYSNMLNQYLESKGKYTGDKFLNFKKHVAYRYPGYIEDIFSLNYFGLPNL